MDPRPESASSAGDGTQKDCTRPRSSTDAQAPEDPQSRQHSPPSDAPERIFPIRSMLSVKPATPSSPDPDLASPTRGGPRHYSIVDQNTWDQIRRRASSNPHIPSPTTSPPFLATKDSASSEYPNDHDHGGQEETEGYVTSRFRHVVTPAGHAILTGRGAPVMACEDEPIHIPGAIQSFGVLLAFREVAEEQLHVHVASENTEAFLGYTPNDLFALHSFTDILSEEQCDQLLDHVDFVRHESYDPAADGPDVFILTVNHPRGRPVRFWCAMHMNPSNRDWIICELEPEDDRVNPPNISGSGNTSPLTPADTLGFDPTPEAFAESTVNISQPLRVLRSARRRRGEEAAMQVFSIVSQVQDQLGRAQSLDVLLNTTVGLVKELTGFHRVMVYQFDPDWNGMVVAELVDPRMTKDLYKGLHFPATDIPKQARDLYRINRVRLLYDRDQLTARLVCRSAEDLETPLDMTHAYLRAMSPIHVKYLANMKVRASMSISINGFNGLWGLISCHSYGASGMRVSFPIRKMCRLIGDTVARNVERLSYASRLQARTLINTMPTDANPSGYIIASSDDLLKLFDADYAALTIRGETKLLGGINDPRRSTDSHEVLALVEFLKIRRLNSVLSSQNVTKDFPDLHYAPTFKSIAGMLYVPLSTDGVDFMTFFRRGRLTEIKWGGNPHEKRFDDGNLEPRKSFQIWKETVLDQSRQWTESEIETAAILCLVYGKFIKVWRENEANSQGSQLTKLLLANSAHEVRTPLNAIINYLEIALEGTLDKDTRDNLSKSYSASKSLIYVINDLLDLTNAEKGADLIKDDSFDLQATFTDASDMFEHEAKRKGIGYTVTLHPGVPKVVVGDQRRVRQALSNLIANAIQHTVTGGVTVEMLPSKAQADDDNIMVEISILDTGAGMSQDTLEILFRELEQVSGAEDESTLRNIVDKSEKQVLGLGLAFIARMVHNRCGQLSVRSEEGKGSHFRVTLQFSLADDEELPSKPPSPTPRATTIEPAGEEFVLVDSKTSQNASLDGTPTQEVPTAHTQNTNPPAEEKPTPAVSALVEETKQLAIKASLNPPVPASDGEAVPAATALQNTAIDQASESKPTTEHETPVPTAPTSPTTTAPAQHPVYRVLVAEDDPINGKILEKRLSKFGHSVRLTVNGEECAATYRADPSAYDVVLMDIQMPLVDGHAATRMIRDLENESGPGGLSDIAKPNGRMPIFAVSASLFERDASLYIDSGFDGWIMKPINFKRLNTVLEGLQNADTRHGATYRPGNWENGGWFTADTKG